MEQEKLSLFDVIELTQLLSSSYEAIALRDRHDFLYHYCFYYADILKKLVPDCQVCLLEDHYFICYENQYLDYRGIIIREENYLDIYGLGNRKGNLNRMIKIEDMEYEKDYSEMIGLTDKDKDKEFGKYKDKLLKIGQGYLSNLNHAKKRNRTITP